MGASWRLHVELLTTAAGLSAVLLLVFSGGAAEWLFGTVMLFALFLVLWLGVAGWQAARAERSRARDLLVLDPHAAAARAVAEERRLLAVDVEATIRESLVAVVAEIEAPRSEVDPVATLQRVQQHARRATSELRRQLGLLRTGTAADVPQAEPPPPSSVLTGRDVALAGLASLLAATESVAFTPTSGLETRTTIGTAALTAAAALTFAGRRAAPAPAAGMCALLFLAGSLLGAPLSEGFWFVLVVGSLIWTLAARGSTRVGLPALVALTAAALGTRVADSPDNVGVTGATVVVAVAGGFAVRWEAARHRSAARAAGGRQQELTAAVNLAVAAERTSVARELHDVVSHAVGLISVQANAGLVSWPGDPDAVHRALAVIAGAARETLGELRRLPAGEQPASRPTDLDALVRRIRSAGTPVELAVDGVPGPDVAPIAYRVIQESLTNVVRHAPGARVTVTVRTDPAGTTVTVRDDGPGSCGGAARGYGLVGLAERVSLAGGALTAGAPTDGHGFTVEAVLPAPDRAAAP